MAQIANRITVKQDAPGMLHRALERIIQLYTDKSHFVYEILQNAEDCEASKIKFVQYEDHLDVFHNGKPFTESNLSGLCDIGKSDKAENLNQIGEFGVGFKSVYGICDTVKLYSNPENYQGKEHVDAIKFAVQINGFITPEDIDYEEMPREYTTHFVFPYTVARSYSGFNNLHSLNETLTNKLSDLGITTLLFMKNLELIEYSIHTRKVNEHGQYSLEKTIINDHCMLVCASGISSEDGDELQKLSFLMFSRHIDRLNNRTVDIAFPVRVVSDAKEYVFEKALNPYVSVYFPTETESKVDFIVQGPYRTTPNRSSIPSEDLDNIRFANETAILLKESLIELRDKGIFNMSLLKILPLDSEAFANSPLFMSLYSTVKDLLMDDNMLPCREGKQYTKVGYAKLARQERIPALITDADLSELIDDGDEYHWLPSVLTENNREYAKVYSFIVQELKIPTLRPEDLRRYFDANESFLQTKDNHWLAELYSIYENIPNVFQKNKTENSMLTCKFIKTSKGRFVAPYNRTEDKQYIPNVFLPLANLSAAGIDFVDEDIYHRCSSFFEDVLKLKQPDEYEFFVTDFKRRYCNSQSIDLSNHINDVKKLIKYSKYEEHSAEIGLLIKELLFLRCDDGKSHKIGKGNLYIPETESGVKIELYYKNLCLDKYFVDIEYYKKGGISEQDLVSLGVINSIILNDCMTEGLYDIATSGRKPNWITNGNFRWKLTLDYLKEALLYISSHSGDSDSIIKSQVILQVLLNCDRKLTGDVIIGGSTPNLHGEKCEAIKTLSGENFKEWDGRWIYTESMELVNASEISKYDIPSVLYGKLNLDSDLYGLLGFKVTVEDEVAAIKKQITPKQLDAVFESELKLRYGITSNYLEHINMGDSDREELSKETFSFPVANLKNWDSLKKHAAEMLAYADPVAYKEVVRQVRVSLKATASRAYLMGMYRYDNGRKYACQLCHEPTSNFESVEIFSKPEVELDPINLCLCPNCAVFYRQLRGNTELMRELKGNIINFVEGDVIKGEHVIISLDSQEIWFTQTHFAEVKLLLKMQNETKKTRVKKPFEEADDKLENPPQIEKKESGEVSLTTEQDEIRESVYDKYVGKKVYRKRDGMIGKISKFEDNYVYIDVLEGPKEGKTIEVQVEFLAAGDIYDIEE